MFIFKKKKLNSNGPFLQIEFSLAGSFLPHSKASLKLCVSGVKLVEFFFRISLHFPEFLELFRRTRGERKIDSDFTDVVAKRRRTMEKLKSFRGIRK